MTSIIPSSNDDLIQGTDVMEANYKKISNQLVSERIRSRLLDNQISYFANDNVADYIKPGELEELQEEVASRFRDLLKSLVVDIDNDHNTEETTERVSRMYIHEVFRGRYNNQPKVTSYPNVK